MGRERRTSGVVTPEAVLLEFETAGVASRALARIVDAVVQAALLVVVLLLAGLVSLATGGRGGAVGGAVAGVGVFAAIVGYPFVLEWRGSGRTVGKSVLGLRVLTREGAPVGPRHAAIRAAVGLLDVYSLPFLAVLATLVSPANQRPGDLVAGTIVVRQRIAGPTVLALRFPPPAGWQDYARTLDVSVVTAGQYRLIRSFLTRVHTFSPEARGRLAWRLADPVAWAMGHPPPPTLGAELFLVCVAAAYQARHAGGPDAPPGPPGAVPGPGSPPTAVGR